MCTLYRMTSNVEAIRRLFGVTRGGFDNLPDFREIYPDRDAPIVRTVEDGARALEIMRWGFPPLPAAGSRPVVNVRNLASPALHAEPGTDDEGDNSQRRDTRGPDRHHPRQPLPEGRLLHQ